MTRKDQLAFIRSIAPAAQQSAVAHGVPASVTIAQAILESGWGQHAPCNNFFGIKKGAANVPYSEFRTTEVVSGKPVVVTAKFRTFPSIAACFDAHAELIGSEPRYSRAMAEVDNPLVFAETLKVCGYSTDPDYNDKLVQLMGEFNLNQYDAAGSVRGKGRKE